MIWSLDQDDYTGLFCHQGQFSFTRRVHDILVSSDKYHEEELSSPTKATLLRTKPKITFIPIQPLTSQRPKSTLTSTPSVTKSNNVGTSVKDSTTPCALLIVVFVTMVR